MASSNRKRERPVEAFTTGLAVTVVFAVLMGVFHGAWYLIFPLVFAGVLPMVRGLSRLVSRRAREEVEDRPEGEAIAPPAPPHPQAQAERQILLVARDNHGVVTPARVALETTISVDEADQILQGLASRGHAAMVVAEDGRVEYQFPEFRPPAAPGQSSERLP